MNTHDLTPPVPLTEDERKHYPAEAEKGKYPTLDIVRRFIATIRTSIKNSPVKTAKTKVSRNKKPVVDETQVDFF
jgi:hypothetical protein